MSKVPCLSGGMKVGGTSRLVEVGGMSNALKSASALKASGSSASRSDGGSSESGWSSCSSSDPEGRFRLRVVGAAEGGPVVRIG